ncbi:MAG: DUF2490 domain-containing protein [Kiritimatiellaeota bacterium]|nr:DUF2490 domain-containing protein [Kiritimatiellota bacterium]
MTHKTLNTTLAAAALIASGLTSANAIHTDTQSRLGFSASKDLGNGVRLDLATEQGLFNNLKGYNYNEVELGFSIKANDWLNIAPVLRFKDDRSYNSSTGAYGSWARETRPMLNATLSYTFEGWKFDDRSRFEWRQYANSSTQNWNRYRNRLKVTSPWKWTDLKINPYASIELMQPLSGQSGGKNRRARQDFEAAIGVSAALTDDLGLDVYYMAEFKEQASNSLRQTANIIGVAMKLKF